MNISHVLVRPFEDPQTAESTDVPRLRMKDFQGMLGHDWRAYPADISVPVLSIHALYHGFHECWLAVLVEFFLGHRTLLVRRSLQNCQLVTLFAVCDGITSTLTLAAACALAGITVLIDNDLGNCSQNHCTQFEAATAMAFTSWFWPCHLFFLTTGPWRSDDRS